MKKRILRSNFFRNIKRSRNHFLLLFFVFLSGCSSIYEITVFYSGNTNGVYENCMCPKVPEGSVLNHITLKKDSIKSNIDALNISNGNYFSMNHNDKENLIVLELLDSLKYDVFSPGRTDLEFLSKMRECEPISFNMVGALSFKTFKIKSKTVCVTGMIDPSYSKYNRKNIINEKSINEISDFIDSLKAFSDIIIFISNIEPEFEKKVFNQVKNIDIMISGTNRKNESFNFDQKIYVSSGSSAEFVGKLVIEKTSKEISYRNSFIKMDYDLIPEDEKSKQFVDSLKNKLGIKIRNGSIDKDL
jgi:hypothetical protein